MMCEMRMNLNSRKSYSRNRYRLNAYKNYKK